MTHTPDASSPQPLARDCASEIAGAFVRYNAEFRAITRRAPLRFDARDSKGSQRDAVERIDLYDKFVNRAVTELRAKLGERALDRLLWIQIRDDFPAEIENLPDPEFAKTFFSSTTRRLLEPSALRRRSSSSQRSSIRSRTSRLRLEATPTSTTARYHCCSKTYWATFVSDPAGKTSITASCTSRMK